MELKGQVIEALANGQFIVELPDKKPVRCYPSGKIRQNHIKIILGDSVDIELPPQSEIGRITFRRINR